MKMVPMRKVFRELIYTWSLHFTFWYRQRPSSCLEYEEIKNAIWNSIHGHCNVIYLLRDFSFSVSQFRSIRERFSITCIIREAFRFAYCSQWLGYLLEAKNAFVCMIRSKWFKLPFILFRSNRIPKKCMP